jgi:hypothetical protein
MKNYSILRVGNEYVVQADEKSILKTKSRRRAARTVTDAAELMDLQQKPQAAAGPSITPDPPGHICDPGIAPDSPEVP